MDDAGRILVVDDDPAMRRMLTRTLAARGYRVDAEACGEAALADLHRGGFLHDIGKIAVPDAVLLKRGPLTTDRPYQAAMSAGEAIEELRNDVRKGWRRAALVDAFAVAQHHQKE